MIIIGFSRKTSKILPRFFCKFFVHVAPILVCEAGLEMWQFIRINKLEKIPLKWRDLDILSRYGWVFVIWDNDCAVNYINRRCVISCVQLTKNILGLKNWRIQTPDALYRVLSRECPPHFISGLDTGGRN